MEGTGAYGAGLARFLGTMGVVVIEVGRPNRQARRAHGKSDSVDAVEAALVALSGRATGVAKTADGNVEAIRVLLVAHRSGRDARITCLNQLRHLGFCAPDELRERFRGVTVARLAETAAALRPNGNGDPVLYATKLAMQTLGRRVVYIDADCVRLRGDSPTSSRPLPRACSTSPASALTPPRCCSSPPHMCFRRRRLRRHSVPTFGSRSVRRGSADGRRSARASTHIVGFRLPAAPHGRRSRTRPSTATRSASTRTRALGPAQTGDTYQSLRWSGSLDEPSEAGLTSNDCHRLSSPVSCPHANPAIPRRQMR